MLLVPWSSLHQSNVHQMESSQGRAMTLTCMVYAYNWSVSVCAPTGLAHLPFTAYVSVFVTINE